MDPGETTEIQPKDLPELEPTEQDDDPKGVDTRDRVICRGGKQRGPHLRFWKPVETDVRKKDYGDIDDSVPERVVTVTSQGLPVSSRTRGTVGKLWSVQCLTYSARAGGRDRSPRNRVGTEGVGLGVSLGTPRGRGPGRSLQWPTGTQTRKTL